MKRIIEIKGLKVNLKPFEEKDAEAVYKHLQDFEIHKNLRQLPYPYTLKNAKEFIEHTHNGRHKGEEYIFGVFENETDKLAGSISAIKIDVSTFEIGYWIGSAYRGNGFASEIIQLITRVCFEKAKISKIVANVFEDNYSSIRVLEKNGFTQNLNYKSGSCNSYKESKVLQFELKIENFRISRETERSKNF